MNPLRIHFQTPLLYSLLCLFLLNGCGGSLLNLSDKTPKELLIDARAYIKAENYVDAKAALNKVLEDYPDSPEKVMASLLLADVHYKNGQYEESKFMFKGFLELYPMHRLADRAYFSVAMSDFQLMDLETRDQTFAQNALEEFEKIYQDVSQEQVPARGRGKKKTMPRKSGPQPDGDRKILFPHQCISFRDHPVPGIDGRLPGPTVFGRSFISAGRIVLQ